MLISPQAHSQFFFMEDPNVGKEISDFTLNSLKGEEVNFTKFRDGQKSILFFWATWCPHCRRELKSLNVIRKEMDKQGIKIVLVNVGEPARIVKKYLEKHKIDGLVLLDKEGALSESYGVIGLPTFFFVDGEGVVKDVTHSLPKKYEKIFKVVSVEDLNLSNQTSVFSHQ